MALGLLNEEDADSIIMYAELNKELEDYNECFGLLRLLAEDMKYRSVLRQILNAAVRKESRVFELER